MHYIRKGWTHLDDFDDEEKWEWESGEHEDKGAKGEKVREEAWTWI